MTYHELENHLKNRISGCQGEWVGKNSGYETGLCKDLGFEPCTDRSKKRYQDATWNECSIELKKGNSIWLDLVRYAELVEEPELGCKWSITLFCIPNKDKQTLSQILGVPTVALIEHLNLTPEHTRLLLELKGHVPHQLNAQARLTVPDIRKLALFVVHRLIEPQALSQSETIRLTPSPSPPISPTSRQALGKAFDAQSFQADHPPDLRFTVVDSATFGGVACRGWNGLVEAAIRCASVHNMHLDRVRQTAKVNIQDRNRTDSGFRPISGTTWSYQSNNAGNAWRATFCLAVELRQPVDVRFRWPIKDGAACPGKSGVMQWKP